MIRCCPTCGRPMPALYGGVELPRVKARIFDAIKAAGEIGIASRDLLDVAYEREDKPRNIETIKAHIFQINELLAGTDTHIVTHDRRHWIVVKRRRVNHGELQHDNQRTQR